MNLIEVMKRFPDQESCISHLGRLRWRCQPFCPHCGSVDVIRKNESGTGRIGRWNCYDCNASFKVTCGTVFHGTKIPLQKWFVAISLITHAKKSLSSHQLSRDVDVNQKTAWYLMTRIRTEMVKKTNPIVLQGIIEADETYIGGKPRKENKKEDQEPAKRGRGTEKTPIIGAVQRGGEVIAKVAESVTSRNILEFIKRFVKIDDSELMTDEFYVYRQIGEEMKHQIVHHKEQFVDGEVHTNTIEGFWSLLKRAWYGQHHHYQTAYTPLYVAERCYLYNCRKLTCIWTKFVNESMSLSRFC